MRDIPNIARMTLTWDQGSEMACHDRLAPLIRNGVFVAHASNPWQRGTNENTNGLLRQYLPKRSDLSAHTPADLQAIEDHLNNRPERPRDGRPQPRCRRRSNSMTPAMLRRSCESASEPKEHLAVILTGATTRLSPRSLNEAFVTARDDAGIDEDLDLHCLRHSYITHLRSEAAWRRGVHPRTPVQRRRL
ncbi:IS30 family transposase [Streptomyces sp. NPDC055085]